MVLDKCLSGITAIVRRRPPRGKIIWPRNESPFRFGALATFLRLGLMVPRSFLQFPQAVLTWLGIWISEYGQCPGREANRVNKRHRRESVPSEDNYRSHLSRLAL
jgi:hypothetical protein